MHDPGTLLAADSALELREDVFVYEPSEPRFPTALWHHHITLAGFPKVRLSHWVLPSERPELGDLIWGWIPRFSEEILPF